MAGLQRFGNASNATPQLGDHGSLGPAAAQRQRQLECTDDVPIHLGKRPVVETPQWIQPSPVQLPRERVDESASTESVPCGRSDSLEVRASGSRFAALQEEVQCLQSRVAFLEAQVAELLAARFVAPESGSEPESEWQRPAASLDGDSLPGYLAHADLVRIAFYFVLPSYLRRDTGRFYVVDVGNSRGRSGLYTTYRSYGEAVRDLALPWPSYHHKLHFDGRSHSKSFGSYVEACAWWLGCRGADAGPPPHIG